MHTIKFTYAGLCAINQLAHTPSAAVIGVTSRGLFLRLDHGRVLFLSHETQRGPLTLNLSDNTSTLARITPGESASVLSGTIVFPAHGLQLDARQAIPWQAPPLPGGLLGLEQRRENLEQVAGLLPFRPLASPLDGLLPLLLGGAGSPPPSHALGAQITLLRHALAKKESQGAVTALAAFIGLGSGLTPSGDDLVAGCLLALARWGSWLLPGLPVAALAPQLLPLADQRTTTLSANLIECACQGQADERLLLALDGILCAASPPSACAAALSAWGNTSGRDALVGMALVILG
jgi:hypothetical protein